MLFLSIKTGFNFGNMIIYVGAHVKHLYQRKKYPFICLPGLPKTGSLGF